MTSKATNAIFREDAAGTLCCEDDNDNNTTVKLNTASLDELLADYNAAIERNNRETHAYAACAALLLVALTTIYLAWVGTLPWLGAVGVCLALLACGVAFVRSAARDGVMFGGGV